MKKTLLILAFLALIAATAFGGFRANVQFYYKWLGIDDLNAEIARLSKVQTYQADVTKSHEEYLKFAFRCLESQAVVIERLTAAQAAAAAEKTNSLPPMLELLSDSAPVGKSPSPEPTILVVPVDPCDEAAYVRPSASSRQSVTHR